MARDIRIPKNVAQVLGITINQSQPLAPSEMQGELQAVLKAGLSIEEPEVFTKFDAEFNERVYIYRSPFKNGLRVIMRERDYPNVEGRVVYSVHARFPSLPPMLGMRTLDLGEVTEKSHLFAKLEGFLKKSKVALDKHYYYVSKDGRIY